MRKLLLPALLMTSLAVGHFAEDNRCDTLLSGNTKATLYQILAASVGTWIAYITYHNKQNAKIQ